MNRKPKQRAIGAIYLLYKRSQNKITYNIHESSKRMQECCGHLARALQKCEQTFMCMPVSDENEFFIISITPIH